MWIVVEGSVSNLMIGRLMVNSLEHAFLLFLVRAQDNSTSTILSRNWDQFNDRHGLLSLFFFKAVSDIELDPRRENPKGNKEIWESREMS